MLNGIEGFALAGSGGVRDKTMAALKALYTGFDHPAATFAMTTVKALDSARKLAETRVQTTVARTRAAGSPTGSRTWPGWSRPRSGLRVATIDLGGWDMHTGLGNVNGGEMRNHLNELGRRSARSRPTSARSSTTSRSSR